MKYSFKSILVDMEKWQGTKFTDYPDWLVESIENGSVKEPTGTVVEQPVVIDSDCCKSIILPGDYLMYYNGTLRSISKQEVDKFLMRHIIKERDLDFGEAYHALINGAFISREIWKERGEVIRYLIYNKGKEIYEVDKFENVTRPFTCHSNDLLANDWFLF